MRPDDGRAIPTFIRQALTGEPITVTGDGSQTRSVCYVDDTVQGVLALAAADHPGPVNIGSPEESSVLELAHAVCGMTQSSVPIRFVDRPVDDPTVRRPDLALASEVLGWKPETLWEDGLRSTIAWFRDQLSGREDLPPVVRHPHHISYLAAKHAHSIQR
jgi:dTDP-glucose 4,6-dehydratase